MGFTLIDYERWKRREIYECFHRTCIYTTVQMDITDLLTGLRARGLKLYPALVYCAASVVNGDPDFRYGYDQEHRIGIWDSLDPLYTLPRADDPELFTMKCTAYAPDFTRFYRAFIQDARQAESCGRLICDNPLPPNRFGLSVMPGTSFTAFNFCGDPKDDLTPFVVYGKFYQQEERVLLPVCGEFSHGVNDGLHVSRFFSRLETAARELLPGG